MSSTHALLSPAGRLTATSPERTTRLSASVVTSGTWLTASVRNSGLASRCMSTSKTVVPKEPSSTLGLSSGELADSYIMVPPTQECLPML